LGANAFYPITATIQKQHDGDRTPSGGFNSPGTWVTIPSLIEIPARRSVPQSAERQANEFQTDWGREDRNTFVVALQGYYPDIDASMRAVLSDGLVFDIRSAVADSAYQMTTIDGRTVNPGTEGYG
jgi:hypothetical protein